MNTVDVDVDVDVANSPVATLLRLLGSGARLHCNQHTLELYLGDEDDTGPGLLWGVNAYGQDYVGSLTRRYVRWWKEMMLAGKTIGPAPAEPARNTDEALVAGFFDRLDQSPAVNPAPEPPAFKPTRWAQQAVASQLLALLDDDHFRTYPLNDLDHALQRLRTGDCEHWRIYRHPDYPGLQALCGVNYKSMERDVAEGLPAALLRAFGLETEEARAVLGEFAPAVIARYEHGVLPPSAPVTTLQPMGLRRWFSSRAV